MDDELDFNLRQMRALEIRAIGLMIALSAVGAAVFTALFA